jgi:phage portal protein BeeE
MLGRLIPWAAEERALSMTDYESLFTKFGFNGVQYVTPVGSAQELTALEGAGNPIVAACIHTRMMVFSEARLTFQRYSASRPGEMFGTPDLAILEQPWPAATTGDLLARMEADVSLFGNSYWIRAENQLVRLDPSRVQVLTGSVEDRISANPIGARLIGYRLVDKDDNELAFFNPSDICHYKPLAHPLNPFRGQSWLSAVIQDVQVDGELTDYKSAFLSNAATPNMVVSFDPTITKEAFDKFRESMEARHRGTANAYRTLYLGGGADVKVVGANFEQIAMKAVQGAGETRIAAAAGVPASILGISEGLAGSSLNAGNYTAARRRFADGTLRPLWRSACGSLQTLVPPPDGGARLWFDDRDVSFLQEDVDDAAATRQKDAQTMRTLVDGGFDPASVVSAVTTGDMSKLVHTGQLSVQLQPPGATEPTV